MLTTHAQSETLTTALAALCDEEATFEERLLAAQELRVAFGLPTEHELRCAAVHDLDEECDCPFWDEPPVLN